MEAPHSGAPCEEPFTEKFLAEANRALGIKMRKLTFMLILSLLTIEGPMLTRSSGSIETLNPHQPQKVTWLVISAAMGMIANSTTKVTPPDTWWPDLEVDLCALATGSWDIGDQTLGETRPECGDTGRGCTLPLTGSPREPGCSHLLKQDALSQTDFYVCPGSGRILQQLRNCQGADSYYCYNWGCETTGTGYWIKDQGLVIVKSIQRPRLSTNPVYGRCTNFHCNALRITFTEEGWWLRVWDLGKTWGLRLYVSGRDPGLLFTIRKWVDPLTGLP